MTFYTDDNSHTRCSCCDKRWDRRLACLGDPKNPKKRGRKIGYSKIKYVVTFNEDFQGVCDNLFELRDMINILKGETLNKQQVYRLTTNSYTKTKRYSGLKIKKI